VTFNRRTGRLVTGHQRVKHIPADAPINLTTTRDEPDAQGTVALGYVEFGGESWAYREVDWDEATEIAANIAANKHGGEFDIPKLAELLSEIDANGFDAELTGFSGLELESLLTWTPPEGKGDGLLDPAGDGREGDPAGVKEETLRFRGLRIPMTTEEADALETRLGDYTKKTGAAYGFVTSLLQ
jgi:hypothetical protein